MVCLRRMTVNLRQVIDLYFLQELVGSDIIWLKVFARVVPHSTVAASLSAEVANSAFFAIFSFWYTYAIIKCREV